ncbi:MAG: flippase-like domain-containing protein [Candidatus Brocadiae bacterium]|nr:flippase-like domain-containing protein [Candidatus Brocadiia bacterium]
MDRRKASWTALKVLAVVLIVVILYVVLQRIGFRSIFRVMQGASPGSIRSAVLLTLGAFLLSAVRWQQLIKREERKSIVALFPIYMAGVFGNIITPGARVGGAPIRAYYMSKAFGGEKSAHLGTILTDKLGSGLVFVCLLVASVSFVVLFVPLGLVPKIVLEGVVLFLIAAVVGGFVVQKRMGPKSRLLARLLPVVYNSALLKFVRRRFATYQLFENYAIRKLDNVLTPIAQAAGSPKALAKIIFISGASWALLYMAHFVLFVGLGARIGLLQVIVIVTIADFLGDISVSPGGAGFMEAAMIGLCAAFGVNAQTAAAVTLVSRGVFYLCGLGVGGLCLGVLTGLYGRQK